MTVALPSFRLNQQVLQNFDDSGAVYLEEDSPSTKQAIKRRSYDQEGPLELLITQSLNDLPLLDDEDEIKASTAEPIGGSMIFPEVNLSVSTRSVKKSNTSLKKTDTILSPLLSPPASHKFKSFRAPTKGIESSPKRSLSLGNKPTSNNGVPTKSPALVRKLIRARSNDMGAPSTAPLLDFPSEDDTLTNISGHLSTSSGHRSTSGGSVARRRRLKNQAPSSASEDVDAAAEFTNSNHRHGDRSCSRSSSSHSVSRRSRPLSKDSSRRPQRQNGTRCATSSRSSHGRRERSTSVTRGHSAGRRRRAVAKAEEEVEHPLYGEEDLTGYDSFGEQEEQGEACMESHNQENESNSSAIDADDPTGDPVSKSLRSMAALGKASSVRRVRSKATSEHRRNRSLDATPRRANSQSSIPTHSDHGGRHLSSSRRGTIPSKPSRRKLKPGNSCNQEDEQDPSPFIVTDHRAFTDATTMDDWATF